MKYKTIINSDILIAAEHLKNHEIVAIPTETVYGLAANALSIDAVNKIYKVKNRPKENPLIIHIYSIDQLNEIVTEFPLKAKKLADKFWPGPLTMIFKKNDLISDQVTAGKQSVAIRIPNHRITLELLKLCAFPIAAPSANPFKYISPTKPEHVLKQLSGKIPYILDGGKCDEGIESTIISFVNKKPELLRLRSFTKSMIEEVIGKIEVRNKSENTYDAPGMMSQHYSPKHKMILTENISEELKKYSDLKIGVLTFNSEVINSGNILIDLKLSEKGDLIDAAHNLYDALHQIDEKEIDLIIAEKLPDHGIGISINDRLTRASTQNED